MRGQRGQATVELILALPVVVLMVLFVVQVGLVARAQLLVAEAAREGARAGAVEGTASAASRAATATPGLDPARIGVHADIDARPGGMATVEVRYRMATDVPLVGALVPDRQLTATLTMRVEEPAAVVGPGAGS